MKSLNKIIVLIALLLALNILTIVGLQNKLNSQEQDIINLYHSRSDLLVEIEVLRKDMLNVNDNTQEQLKLLENNKMSKESMYLLVEEVVLKYIE